MNHQPPSRDVKARRGFTLIELLTVIAIIVILIGILLPVVGAVRRAAYQASTQAVITNLTAAIERYQQDFNAYPGPVTNNVYGAMGTALPPEYPMTMSENLVVALVGGWDWAAAPSPGTYSPASVGQGPMSHNQIASARRRWPAYIDAVEGANFPRRNSLNKFDTWATVTEGRTRDDSEIPEFLDAFPDQLPILYIRASVGKSGIQNLNGQEQYNPFMLVGRGYDPGNAGIYRRPPFTAPGATTPNFKGDFLMTNPTNDPDEFASWTQYFQDPNLPTQPRQKDGYWLISAGPDRRYGTRDDQTNFGGFR